MVISMEPPKRAPADPTERRSEILAAARAVFLRRGLKSATVSEITSDAGVAKGTFYLYFDSREAVLEAIREEADRDLLENLESVLKRKNRVQALADLVRTTIESRSANRSLHGLQTAPADGAGSTDSDRRLRRAFSRFIAEGVKTGDFEARDPQSMAALLLDSIRDAPPAAIPAATDLFRAALVKKQKKK